MTFFGGADYQRAPSSEGEEGFADKDVSRKSQQRSWLSRCQWLLLLANLILLAINVVLSIAHFKPHWADYPELEFVIPPLKRVLSYQVRKTDLGIGQSTPYGRDTVEADELWKEISQDGPYGWITVQKSDLEKINQTSVRLEDGSGYLAGVEVFHELHCLNWFRRRMLGREFGPEEDPMPDYHLAHCLDILRLSIQCHADLSLMPLRWVEGYPFPWPIFQTTRQCRNWDNIMSWTKKHSIGAAGRVVHPQLGPVDGKDFDPKTLPRVGHMHFLDEE
ncbi:MAG: hypothetical protein M1819_003474 [Sarea resinae]|nr:MAG: hypothetical protein M1819_003474 [Sarea resinae]